MLAGYRFRFEVRHLLPKDLSCHRPYSRCMRPIPERLSTTSQRSILNLSKAGKHVAVDPRPLDSITPIDCNHMSIKDYVNAYMMIEGDEVAFVDNCTRRAIPTLMSTLGEKKMSPEQVKYIIITHAHLDNAGGTSLLVDNCPNATVLAHPSAVHHLVDPQALVKKQIELYGKHTFFKLYDDVLPIPQNRIKVVEDGEVIHLGSRPLEFIHTPGHDSHHMVVIDSSTKSAFTGDAFGISYISAMRVHRVPDEPGPLVRMFGLFKNQPSDSIRDFLFPSSPPGNFQPADAHRAVDRIVSTGVERAFLTHCGVWTDMQMGAIQLHHGLQQLDKIIQGIVLKMREAQDQKLGIEEYELLASVEKEMHAFFCEELQKHGIQHEAPGVWDLLQLDEELNAQGLIMAAKKQFMKDGGLFYAL